MKKILFIALLTLILFGFSVEKMPFLGKKFQTTTDTVSIIGVGDMMLGTNYPDASYLPANDGKNLLAPVNEILKDADVTFGNLEGTVLNEGGTVKRCSNPAVCYAFRMPDKLVDNLLTAGFDVLSIANNHVGDFGAAGYTNTSKVLKEKGLYFAGLTTCPTTIFEKNGVKYGMVAFAPNPGCMQLNDLATAQKVVKELATKVDIVIVSFHGGAEGAGHQRVTRKSETFYGENRGNVYDFAHKMVDAGADIIFGHGPHVTRAIDIYQNRFIIYSMGNFCTYNRFNLQGVSGLAPIMKVFTDKQGKFLKGQIIPIIQPHPGGVKLDPNNGVIKVLQNLTKSDFPELPIKITDKGEVFWQGK